MSIPIGPITIRREPLTNITPFTYGDGYTYLRLLEDLRKTVGSLGDVINGNNSVWEATLDQIELLQNNLITEINSKIVGIDLKLADFRAIYNEDYKQLHREMLQEIRQATSVGTTYDPTTGSSLTPLPIALEHVYDNLRIYAYTALEYDELELTDIAYDALDLTAYQYDILANHS